MTIAGRPHRKTVRNNWRYPFNWKIYVTSPTKSRKRWKSGTNPVLCLFWSVEISHFVCRATRSNKYEKKNGSQRLGEGGENLDTIVKVIWKWMNNALPPDGSAVQYSLVDCLRASPLNAINSRSFFFKDAYIFFFLSGFFHLFPLCARCCRSAAFVAAFVFILMTNNGKIYMCIKKMERGGPQDPQSWVSFPARS